MVSKQEKLERLQDRLDQAEARAFVLEIEVEHMQMRPEAEGDAKLVDDLSKAREECKILFERLETFEQDLVDAGI